MFVRLLRSRMSRTVLTVVGLLATQVGFAGQLCSAVMVAVVPDGVRGYEVIQLSASGSDARLPCCDGRAMPAGPCVTALGGMSMVALGMGSAPLFDCVPPSKDRSTIALLDASSSLPCATVSVGPPLAAHILFGRFLS